MTKPSLSAIATMKEPVSESVTYADAKSRGLVRLWKQNLARDYAMCLAAFDDFHRAGKKSPVRDMVLCSKAGRRRALERIDAAIRPGAVLETVCLNGSRTALWSILKPRGPLHAMSADGGDVPAGETQACAAMNY